MDADAPAGARSGPGGGRKKLLVVGAGISGLAGAWWAREAGHDVEVLEAAEIPGGRVACVEHEGDRVPVGAQYYHRCYRDVTDLLTELGFGDRFQRVGHGQRMVHAEDLFDARRATDLRRLLSVGGKLSALYFGMRYLGPGKRFPSHELRADVPAMDDRLLSDAVAHLDRTFVDTVVRPTCRGLAQAEPELVSLLHYVRLANMQTRTFSIPGGTYSLAEALADRLPVEYGARVATLLEERGRVVGARLEDGSERRADHVLLALPGQAAARVVPGALGELKANLESSRHGAAIVPVFFLDRAVQGGFANYLDTDPDRPFAVGLDHAGSTPSGRSAVALFGWGRAAEPLVEASDDTVLALAMEQLGRFLPDFNPNWVVHASVKRHPFGAPRFPVGQYRRNWELQQLAERQPGLSLTDARGAHQEASVRRARWAVRNELGRAR